MKTRAIQRSVINPLLYLIYREKACKQTTVIKLKIMNQKCYIEASVKNETRLRVNCLPAFLLHEADEVVVEKATAVGRLDK